jgi:hypothetical protein
VQDWANVPVVSDMGIVKIFRGIECVYFCSRCRRQSCIRGKLRECRDNNSYDGNESFWEWRCSADCNVACAKAENGSHQNHVKTVPVTTPPLDWVAYIPIDQNPIRNGVRLIIILQAVLHVENKYLQLWNCKELYELVS